MKAVLISTCFMETIAHLFSRKKKEKTICQRWCQGCHVLNLFFSFLSGEKEDMNVWYRTRHSGLLRARGSNLGAALGGWRTLRGKAIDGVEGALSFQMDSFIIGSWKGRRCVMPQAYRVKCWNDASLGPSETSTLKGQRKIFQGKQKLCVPKGFAKGNLETDSRYNPLSFWSQLSEIFLRLRCFGVRWAVLIFPENF